MTQEQRKAVQIVNAMQEENKNKAEVFELMTLYRDCENQNAGYDRMWVMVQMLPPDRLRTIYNYRNSQYLSDCYTGDIPPEMRILCAELGRGELDTELPWLWPALMVELEKKIWELKERHGLYKFAALLASCDRA